MRFADELISSDSLEIPTPSRTPTKREIEMAGQLVDSLHERFDPGSFADSSRTSIEPASSVSSTASDRGRRSRHRSDATSPSRLRT
jgi:non-homologous end joining protein Ku